MLKTMKDVFKRNQLKFLPNQQVSPQVLYFKLRIQIFEYQYNKQPRP